MWKYSIGERVLYRPAHMRESKMDYSGVYIVVAQYVRRDRYGDFVQYGLLPWSDGEKCFAPMVKAREDEVVGYKEDTQ